MSSVSRTLVLRVILARPFTARGGVCRRLQDQTGSSCFTSSAVSSRSQNSTNCFNNNAMRGLASQSDTVQIGGGGIPHHNFPAQGLFTRKWEGRCQPQFTRKKKQKTSGRLSPKEKTGRAGRRKSNYVVRSRWHYGCSSSGSSSSSGVANLQQGRHGVAWEQENKGTSNMELSLVWKGRETT